MKTAIKYTLGIILGAALGFIIFVLGLALVTRLDLIATLR